MNENVDTLAGLDRGQYVRLTLEDGTEIEGRSNQLDYSPDESLRIELTTDESGDYGRYQVLANAEDGDWSPVEVQGYDSEHAQGDWTPLGKVDEVEPMEDHRMMDSEVDSGHEG